ncbi:uncharacterized protein LOC115111983 [Oncorhynchus nerka]|uniref:uncharacterized protein LOC115111983 n=1 Tax=Oncorhynchus nerka TaxID=8023 RepID=UPI0011303BAD|nr:sperm acrosome-associated protein 9 [Oncorhynchus nerka]
MQRAVLRLLKGNNQSPGGVILDTGCFSATTSANCSYPHDKVNRLSCDEARNYYSGVDSEVGRLAGVGDVSFSPTGHATGAHNTKKTQAKRTGAWHAIKPAWRPPGLTTRIRPFPS